MSDASTHNLAEFDVAIALTERFEAAWRTGPAPDLDSFLPPEPGRTPLLVAHLVWVDLDYRWRAGAGPRTEDYIARFPQLRSTGYLSEIVAAEYRAHRRRDPSVPRQTFLDRFPDLVARLAPLLARVDAEPQHTTLDESSAGTPVDRPTVVSPAGQSVPLPPEPPVALPGYEFRKSLGMGGMGVVYAMYERRLGRTLALKTIRREYAIRPGVRKRFEDEMTITARLEHPGLVPVHESGVLGDGRPYYVMKVVAGDTLAKLLSNRPHPLHDLARFLQLFVQVCNPLAYAHSAGIVHRDLKPANIMVGAFGEVQVMDWGLARNTACDEPAGPAEPADDRPTDAGATAGAAIGTPAFMSPEQARGEPSAARPTTDIYALGAILFVILTGKAPREGNADAALKQARTGDTPAPRTINPKVPQALDAICRKAMAPRPAERYATAQELADDVQRWVRDERVQAWREPWTARAWRWMRENRLKVTSAMALLAAAVPLSVALAVISDRAREQAVNDAKRISDEKIEADRQRVRAEQNLTLVEGLAGDVVERVIDNPRLKEADLLETRDTIAAQILATYRQAAAQRGGDPTSVAAVARADRLAGSIARDRERHTEAVVALRRAEAALANNPAAALDLGVVRSELGRALYELGRPTEAAAVLAASRKGLEAVPDRPAAARTLGRGLNNLGLVLHGLGRHNEADEAYRAAGAVHEARSDGPAAPGEARADLAMALSNHGILLREMGRRGDARKAYERSIRLTEEAIALRPDLRSLKRQHAFARANLAGLLQEENDQPGAVKQIEAAVQLMAALVNEMPSVPEYQAALASLTQTLQLMKKGAADPRTLAASTAAVRLFRQQVTEHPGTAEFRRNLGHGLRSHSRILWAASKPDEALTAAREAVDVLTTLSRDHPDEATYRLELAQAGHELGDLLYLGQKYADAEAAYRLDLEACEQLSRDSPDAAEYRERIGRASYTVGMAIDGTNRPAVSLPYYDRTIALLAAPVAADPAKRINRDALLNSYWGRAECLVALNRPKDAVPAWRGMIALISEASPDHRNYRLKLAQTLLKAGDRSAAIAEADAVFTDPRSTPAQKKAADAIRTARPTGAKE